MYRYCKRALDIAASLGLLLVCAPLLGLIALLIRAGHDGPVLFRQSRPGLHGKIFVCRKFRTMRSGADPDHRRLTKLGRVLRRLSLDELPQFWNVLCGDMSFIGPRPLLEEYLPCYTPRQARRHEVRPGLTGWAQIHGRNTLDWDTRLEMDVWYVEHCSFFLDLRIFGRTLCKIITGHGINSSDTLTMEKLTDYLVRTKTAADVKK
ncbi:MAG: sugar transferase [Oscillospiraceae bacterium]|jgi:sugar transferase EpsL|nr:sugar transferase [Oscillospiraceae bacterium]